MFLVNVDCEECKGTGSHAVQGTGSFQCEVCKGAGKSAAHHAGLKGGPKATLGNSGVCLKCRGTGKVVNNLPAKACPYCNGTGKIKLFKKLVGD